MPRGLVVNQAEKSCDGSTSNPGPSSQTTSSAPSSSALQVTPTRPRRAARVDGVGDEVDEHLRDLVGVAAQRRRRAGRRPRGCGRSRASRRSISARAARSATRHGAPLDAVADHAAQARHEALEAVDLFAADVDLLGVERRVGRVAPEDGAEEVDGVAHLVGDLGGDRLDEREALGLPRGGLLLPAPLELGVAVRVRQGEGGLVGDRAEEVDVVAS